MHTLIVFRHLEPIEPLRERIESLLGKLDRHFPNDVEARVVVYSEKHRAGVEIIVNAPTATLSARAETDDFASSLEQAHAALTRRIKRYREKMHAHRGARHTASFGA